MKIIGAYVILLLGVIMARPVIADEGRIIGGSYVPDGRWPAMVAVRTTLSNGTALCGGTLIAANWVLTAAHCVMPNGQQASVNQITVTSGVVNLADRSAEKRGAAEIVVHPGYSGSTLANDIALIRLVSPVSLNTGAMLSTVATDEAWALPGQGVVTAGWGRTSNQTYSTSVVLKQVDIAVATPAACKQTWGKYVGETQICVSTPSVGPCNGDSGGPLMASNRAGGHVLVGLTSFGPTASCADRNQPTVYTRVSSYIDWIRQSVPEALTATTLQSGWWHVPDQGGRGFSIEFRSGRIFLAAFMYEDDGSAGWYMSNGAMADATTYRGVLNRFAGGPTLNTVSVPRQIGTPGTIELNFTSNTTARITLNGQTFNLARYDITAGGGAAGTGAGMPETGWYWNPDEGGRGYFVEVQRDQAFIGTFMYRADGAPTWYYFSTTVVPTGGDGSQVQSMLGGCTGGQTLADVARVPVCQPMNQSVTVIFPTRSTAELVFSNGHAAPLLRYSAF
jgi:V8-like Glu-specific endopeptidase